MVNYYILHIIIRDKDSPICTQNGKNQILFRGGFLNFKSRGKTSDELLDPSLVGKSKAKFSVILCLKQEAESPV